MIENLIGKRYAEALSSSVKDDSLLNSVLENLQAIQSAFAGQNQLSGIFANPAIPLEKKNNLVGALCDRLKVEQGVRNLMLMLSERNKVLFLKNISEYFEKIVDRRLNQIRVSVRSADNLTSDNIERLRSALSNNFGKTVLIDTHVDESLIGGVQLKIGDQVADATIKNRLTLLKQKLEKEEVA
ncbi:MAG: ATP synthase F1 subunit delta [Nitrospinae bacterium]|jgi:F-type H+-transporting ATPase subunit delta|nr:ATP synthase F1 subunit delta [Nitrospinota bacterium]MDA1109988.1 ATP synthase F1 subunit delta [Nitrospinota bacterium]